MSEETVTVSTEEWQGPKTIDEAQSFDSGYKAGLTAYAREKGDSTLKSENELLRRLMDEQGWRTIETFERLASVVPAVLREYYYKSNRCRANLSTDSNCECWHLEGTGPYPEGFILDFDGSRKELKWREKPL